MNIAVLLYGRILNYREHYSNIIESIGKEHTIDFFYASDLESEYDVSEFHELYKPMLCKNEKISYPVDFSIFLRDRPRETSIHNMTCHFINKERVFALLEHHVEQTGSTYDCILSTRVDIKYHEPFYWEKIINNDPSVIFIPDSCDAHGINDQIAIGNLSSMKKYMNIYSNTIPLLERGVRITGEAIFKAHIDDCGLNVCRFPLNYGIYHPILPWFP